MPLGAKGSVYLETVTVTVIAKSESAPRGNSRDDRLDQRIMQTNANQGCYDYYLEAEYDGTEWMIKMP